MPASETKTPSARKTAVVEVSVEPMSYAEAKVFIENAQKYVVACNERNVTKADHFKRLLTERIEAQYDQ